MLKKLIALLTSIPATLISGSFLLLSLIFRTKLPFDFAWFSVFISGIPILYSAIRKLICNSDISKISSAFLISIAMLASIAIGDLFAAGEVAFIMAIGELLEDITTGRAKKGLNKLISLAPVRGRRITGSKEETVDAKEIRLGDVVRVLPGETIPVDGVIISGETSIDQSVMTGESLPVDKEVGHDVFCGTLNCFGAIDIKATKVGQDSSLQKLINILRDVEGKKAPMARMADKCASWLVPAALATALITALATHDITRAVTVLVVFCPCSLVLATPTAIMAAVGQAAKNGVVIKSGEALERMGKVDTVAFDKTGTLTFGKLAVCDICSFDSAVTSDALLSLAASAEAKSEHPIGKAICAFAKETNLKLSESASFRMSAGKGVMAQIDGREILCGNEAFLLCSGITPPPNAISQLDEFRACGKACVLVADSARCIGAIALSDTLRPNAKSVVSALSEMNTSTVLLTGDGKLTAEHFANSAGITKVYSSLLPEEKVGHIQSLEQSGRKVCMVGDGVNDAPALKSATVGVAMGSIGSDITVEAADIALMSDDISRIPYLKRLSTATLKTIKLSISLSMIINFMAVILSVRGILTPTTGALVHNAGSCFVVLLAAMLYDKKLN